MKLTLFPPSEKHLSKWLKARKIDKLSYPFPEITKHDNTFPGYDHDKNQVYLGQGEKVYQSACKALSEWKMFPAEWTQIYAPFEGFPRGEEVAVLFKMFGFRWWNSCRIVYNFDEKNRFGFAYGTLESHVEMGEEIFYIERNEKGEVYYKIEAFSRPNKWFTKIGYPLARAWQRRFVRDSFLGMKAATRISRLA